MGKGEIARYKQFLLFPECFQKACFPRASKDVIVWEWIKVGGLLIQVVSNDLYWGRNLSFKLEISRFFFQAMMT